MRILIVAPDFAPSDLIGARRWTQMSIELLARGFDVKVLTGIPSDTEQNIWFPESRVIRNTSCYWPSRGNERAAIEQGSRSQDRRDPMVLAGSDLSMGLLRKLRRMIRVWLLVPDQYILWAIQASRRLRVELGTWKPDVVISTSLPFSGHLVGRWISARNGAAWVADFRDLFVDNPYLANPRIRRSLDIQIQKAVMRRVDQVVSVSNELSAILENQLKVPVRTIMNGTDRVRIGTEPPPLEDAALRIVYTGTLYENRRDPVPVALAIRDLQQAGLNCRLVIAGSDIASAHDRLYRAGLMPCVEILGQLDHASALRLQETADILLILLWNDKSETATVTGKVFEYLETGRPILCWGNNSSTVAKMVSEAGLGWSLDDSESLKAVLRECAFRKKSEGSVPGLSSERLQEFSRTRQVDLLVEVLREFPGTRCGRQGTHEVVNSRSEA